MQTNFRFYHCETTVLLPPSGHGSSFALPP
jgi:hypothetical protein